MRIIFLLPLLIFILPSVSEAQQLIRCESDGNNFKFCRAGLNRGDDVQLTRRFSKASCERGYSWGLERGGIWVDRGCRADFSVSRSYQQPAYQPGRRVRGDRLDRGNGIRYRGRDGDRRFDYNNRYDQRDQRYDDRYDRRDIRSERELRRERRRLAEERRQLEEERKNLQRRRKNVDSKALRGSCPAGARIGRCSKSERARGCKDWKAKDLTPCKSGG